MGKEARILSIVNQKGGVGKTTTSVNVATGFAVLGKKVLLIDLDPQGNSSTGFGISADQRQKTIYDNLIGEYNINECTIPTLVPNLNIVTSTVDLCACDIELADIENKELILSEKLKIIKNDYDLILIDCPPSLGLLTINALSASDSIVIPMQCEFYSLEGLSHLLSTLEIIKDKINGRLDISGILLTMYDPRNKLTEQVEKDVRSFLGKKVFTTIIPRNIRLSEAPSHGVPCLVYDSKCQGSLAYMALVNEINKREKI